MEEKQEERKKERKKEREREREREREKGAENERNVGFRFNVQEDRPTDRLTVRVCRRRHLNFIPWESVTGRAS